MSRPMLASRWRPTGLTAVGPAVVAAVLLGAACGSSGEAADARPADQVDASGDADRSVAADGSAEVDDGEETNSADESDADAGEAGGAGDPPDGATPGVVGTPGPGRLVDATVELGIEEALVGIRGHAVAAADVDGDGWTDLFVGTFANRPVDSYRVRGADGPAPDALLMGSAAGFFASPDFEGRLGRTAGAAFADLDADGDPDLIVSRNVRPGDRAGEPSEIYRNDGGMLVPAVVLDDDRGGRAVVTLDLDGDDLLDIVLVEDRWSGGSTAVFHNEGDLRFTEIGDEIGFPDDVFGLGAAVGDLDGDGIEDLVVGGSNRWFLGDGDGRLTEGAGSPLPWELHGDEDDPAHVVLTDVDADGRLDIVMGQHFNSTVDDARPEPIRLFHNLGIDGGELGFADVTEEVGLSPLGTKSPQVLAVDLDLDGDPELVTTATIGPEAGPHRPVLMVDGREGDGLPDYTPPAGATGPHYWIDAVVLDADRDGRPDLFFVEWEPAISARLFLNVAEG